MEYAALGKALGIGLVMLLLYVFRDRRWIVYTAVAIGFVLMAALVGR